MSKDKASLTPRVDVLVALIGQSTGTYPEWSIGEKLVIDKKLSRFIDVFGQDTITLSPLCTCTSTVPGVKGCLEKRGVDDAMECSEKNPDVSRGDLLENYGSIIDDDRQAGDCR